MNSLLASQGARYSDESTHDQLFGPSTYTASTSDDGSRVGDLRASSEGMTLRASANGSIDGYEDGSSLGIELVLVHQLSERAQSLLQVVRRHDGSTSGGVPGVGETIC